MNNIYLKALGPWEVLQKKLTWTQLGEFCGKRILEFGCGNGIMGAYYADTNEVTSIEPDKEVLDNNKYDNVKQICGDINELRKFEDAYFDIILCHNVLEYAIEREDIMKEFQRLLKSDGMISILKHNRAGRVMQMAVLLNNFQHANDLLDGKDSMAFKYGSIRYYNDDDLVKWAPELKIKKILGMRTFFDLQQNQEIHKDEAWQIKMMEMEQRVSDIDEFRNVAFFHHVILMKA